MIKRKLHWIAAGFLCAAYGVAGGASDGLAASVADFYRSKPVDLIVGLPPGGGYDAYGRLIARHLSKYIPGSPAVLPQNMPGAGGLRAAGYLYNNAPKDGSAFGIVASSTLLEPLFKTNEANLFKAVDFGWLGSASQDVSYCAVGRSSHVASFADWLKSKRSLAFGASGPAAITYQHPMVLKNVLGANLHVVSGYGGTSDITLAVERGEVDGICGMFASSIGAQFKPYLESGAMKLIIQMGPFRDKTFGDIPSVNDFASTDEQRQILSLAFDQLALGRPFMTPPGVPADRLAALKTAFAKVLEDPALLADAKRSKLDIDYLSGDDARSLLEKFARYPADIIRKAKLAMGL